MFFKVFVSFIEDGPRLSPSHGHGIKIEILTRAQALFYCCTRTKVRLLLSKDRLISILTRFHVSLCLVALFPHQAHDDAMASSSFLVGIRRGADTSESAELAIPSWPLSSSHACGVHAREAGSWGRGRLQGLNRRG